MHSLITGYGNRHGRARAYLNQFLTMVIGGFWHGASWMYVIWGAYHGLLLVAHKVISKVWKLPEGLAGRPEVKVLNIAITFMLVVAGFTLFFSLYLETVAVMGQQIFGDFHLSVLPQFVEGYILIVGALVASMAAHFTPRSWTTGTARVYEVMPVAFQAAILALVIFLVIQTRQSEIVPFIYLQY